MHTLLTQTFTILILKEFWAAVIEIAILNNFNSVQTRCIVKGEAQKTPLLGQFSGVF